MRTLILMRGTPACGKSTWIESHGFGEYVLSPDSIRLMYSSPIITKNNELGVEQGKDHIVWETLFKMLEHRMMNGDFTIIDATHTTTKSINQYRKLCSKYRYRCIVVDLNDVFSLETKIEFDSKRRYKKVGEDVIRMLDARIKIPDNNVPNWVSYINSDHISKLKHYINYTSTNVDSYKNIKIFPKGAYTESGIRDEIEAAAADSKNLIVLTGTYFLKDMNDLELKNLLSLISMKNVVALESVQETRVRNNTSNDGGNKDLSRILNLLSQAFFFCGHDIEDTLVTASGVFPYDIAIKELYKISSAQFIGSNKNTANFIDSKVRQIFDNRFFITKDSCYNTSLINLKCDYHNRIILNIETKTGMISADKVSIKKWIRQCVEDTSHSPNSKSVELLTQDEYVESLCKSNDIKIKNFGKISSYNFKRGVFNKRKWTDLNIRARGLFINNDDNTIAARAYDKFFNIDEMPFTKRESLEGNLEFPVQVYEKYNGFLGILSYNKFEDSLLFCSKSSIQTEYALEFERIFRKDVSEENIKLVKDLVKEGWSLVFEVISPNFDPHIIENTKDEVILIESIKNKKEFEKAEFDKLEKISKLIGIKCKNKLLTANSLSELFSFIDNLSDKSKTEGAVVEDSNGFLFKVKTKYYNTWRGARLIVNTFKNRDIDATKLKTKEELLVYNECIRRKNNGEEIGDIISIRKSLGL
jgi:predicted kinase